MFAGHGRGKAQTIGHGREAPGFSHGGEHANAQKPVHDRSLSVNLVSTARPMINA
jgi:hypothetical protein